MPSSTRVFGALSLLEALLSNYTPKFLAAARRLFLAQTIMSTADTLRNTQDALKKMPEGDFEAFCAQTPVPPEAVVIASAVCLLADRKPSWRETVLLLRQADLRMPLFKRAPTGFRAEALVQAATVLQAQVQQTRTQVTQSALKATKGV